MSTIKILYFLLLFFICFIQIFPFIFWENGADLSILQYVGGLVLLPGYLFQITTIYMSKTSSNFNVLFGFSLCIGIGLMEIYATNQVINGEYALMAFLITNSLSFVFTIVLQLCVLFYQEEVSYL